MKGAKRWVWKKKDRVKPCLEIQGGKLRGVGSRGKSGLEESGES